MLDKTKTIETLKSTRQYLDEHYGVRHGAQPVQSGWSESIS